MGNGRNKNFYFTFPFFSRADIIVKINGEPATGYGVFCVPNSTGNDFPFTGGHIHFAQAPRATDTVTIERELQLNRLIDYQTTVPLNSSTINQDMNYFFELLKDMKGNLQNFAEKYAEFTDKESAQNLLNRIDAVINEIENLGNISTIQTNINSLSESVSDLTSAIATHTTNIGTNTNDITTLKGYDYVIESQAPTAENNYTWYRKYKSGWVEQGGLCTDALGDGSVTLPVTMADTNYHVSATNEATTSENAWGWVYVRKDTKTTTGFGLNSRYGSGAEVQLRARWMVCGLCA